MKKYFILMSFVFSCIGSEVLYNSSEEKVEPNEDLTEIVEIPIAIITYEGRTKFSEIKPFERIYLNGQAKGNIETTHDPSDPENIDLITDYTWELTSIPEGTIETELDIEENNGLYSFKAPLVGSYIVELFVTNVENIVSEKTSLVIIVSPDEQIRIELVWDKGNDQDLHLIHLQTDQNICNIDDMYFATQLDSPIWFSQSLRGEGSNPRLDRDDVNGYGPENININEPLDGTYRVYVDYYEDRNNTGLTNNTLKIWINGIPTIYTRSLPEEHNVWLVADIVWNDNSATVLPYPTDVPGEIGTFVNRPAPCY